MNIIDKQELNKYLKQLEYFRKLAEEEDAEFEAKKQKNPKLVKQVSEKLEIAGMHITHTDYLKPILQGFARSEEAVEEGTKKRQESLELRKCLDKDLEEYIARFPNATKGDLQARAELEKIKSKYRDALKGRADNQYRKIQKLKGKIQSNFNEWTHFVTITFAENLMDVKRAKNHYKQWAKDMRALYPDFIYVYVMEFQARGGIHFHVLCRMDKGLEISKQKFKETRKTWDRHGSINIKGIRYKYVKKEFREEATKELEEKSQDEQMVIIWSIGNYLTSYLQKGADDMLLFGSQMYGNSEGLKDTIVITNPKKIAQVQRYLDTEALKENAYNIVQKESENVITKRYYNKLMKKE